MRLTDRNLIANLAGTFVTALLQIAVVPLYLRLLGVEAWGVISFFLAIQIVLSLLDLGLGVAISRDLATRSREPAALRECGPLVASMEWMYWSGAVFIAVLGHWLGPGLVAGGWLRATVLSAEEVGRTLSMLMLAFALRWPFGLYWGALGGLQRQTLANGLRTLFELLRHGGAVAVLWWYSADLATFALWQCMAAAVQVAVAAIVVRRCLPAARNTYRFEAPQLRALWRFAGGMSLVSILSVVLTQVDKLVLSGILPLEQFGHYTLAATAAGGLALLSGPVFQAYFPRLSQLHAGSDPALLLDTYHRGCRAVALLVLPAAASGAFGADAWLLLWLRDGGTSAQVALLFVLLLLGNTINALLAMPWALQLAHGWTGLAVRFNAVAVLIQVPTLALAARAYGGTGAALAWCLLNLGYLLVGAALMHRRLLPTRLWPWLAGDVLVPAGAAFAVAALTSRLLPGMGGALAAYAGALAATWAALRGVRQFTAYRGACSAAPVSASSRTLHD